MQDEIKRAPSGKEKWGTVVPARKDQADRRDKQEAAENANSDSGTSGSDGKENGQD